MGNEKLTIEKRKFEIFMGKYRLGKFGNQRLGQAFYDYFKLDRLKNQKSLNNIYAKDGQHALNSVYEMFEFN